MTALPLAGKRILVTRAREQAGRLAEALEAEGAEVLRLPTIEILPPETYAPLDSALRAIAGYDWLIVTSANGATALANQLRVLAIPIRDLQHLQIAAIGPSTAAALSRMGLCVSTMPGEYVAEAVVSLLQDKVAGKRVLLARAAVARDVIPEQLRRHGADIHVVETYRTVIPAGSAEQVSQTLSKGNPLPDAVTFTSASTVNNFFALLTAARVELPHGLRAVSIGPITTAALEAHAWQPAQQALPHDIPGLVKACIRLFTTEVTVP